MLRLFKRERRAWPRYTGHFDVMYGAHPPLILTTSLDLCEAGMTFRTTQAFPPGTELEVRVLARPEDPERGWAVTRALNGRNASLMAFITAGIAPSVPASPTPLTPSGLRSVGLSFLPSSK